VAQTPHEVLAAARIDLGMQSGTYIQSDELTHFLLAKLICELRSHTDAMRFELQHGPRHG
jgi:hypothetical protein